ncbi:MAG: aminoglycoside phosphotransferase [Leptospiraceae bacterium]|nr:MAG: aminoglycoside phosphotransferase [Leptospiraceae bacterium]
MDINFFQELSKSENYPHKPDKVEIKQTHASYIFIVKPYVFKIKKNVNFGFLDFSDLRKRFYYCIEEIKLNQRLCKELYINLVILYYDKNNKNVIFQDIFTNDNKDLTKIDYDKVFHSIIQNINSDSTEIEFAIKMHYIEDKYFLKNQSITIKKLEFIAEKLIHFYNNLQPLNEDYSKKNIIENLEDCKNFINLTIPDIMYRLIKKFNEYYFKKYHYKLQKRIKDGWIKDCHGDLHLEHIIVKNNSICIYDCIEFNKEFRHIDIANDIAFLCMDLEFYGYYRESFYFIKYFYKKIYNYDMIFLQDLYRCYRAFVRGKVYSLKSLQKQISEEEKNDSIYLARKYFNLSFKYALTDIHPTIVVFMGRIGSGKSTLARKFADFLNINIYSSDVIRKSLFGLPLYERTPEHLKSIVYSKLITYIVYNKMIENAIKSSLKDGIAVIDGTFATRSLRNIALFRSFEENIKILFIEVETQKEIIIERLKKRQNSKEEVSDAGIEEFLSFYDKYEPPLEIPINHKIKIKIQKEWNIDKLFNYMLRKILIHRFSYKHIY